MIDNPYWDEIEPFVRYDKRQELRIVRLPEYDWLGRRRQLVHKYSWTITDPETFDFVRAHCPNRALDPLAGSGYWAWLLGQVGIEVLASDRHPPHPEVDLNRWHTRVGQHVPVKMMDAVEAMRFSESQDTLLLSWPPVSGVAEATLSAFRGNLLIYIGEALGSCASPQFWQLVATNWHAIGGHTPVQYEQMHDHVTVWSRNKPVRAS